MAWSPLGPHNIPFYSGFGVETPFGILLPPGSKVAAYVRSGGVSSQDSPEIQSHLVQTLAAGLRYVRSGRGDTVILLPGHSESVVDATMLDNLQPSTRVLGIGWGTSQPTFNWTATGSKWSIGQQGCIFSGLRLNLDGANGVVKAIEVLAFDARIEACRIRLASGAALKATIGIEVGANGNSFQLAGCDIRGTATHNVTDGIKIASAVTHVRIVGNVILASATAANGLIHATAAATELYIANNRIYNTHTASSSAITVDAVAATGIICDNYLGTLGSTASQPLLIGAGADLRLFNNLATDTGGASTVSQSGIVNPPGVTL